MGSILIAMPHVEDANRISDKLSGYGLLMDIEVCQSASEVLRISNDRDFGVIICTKSLRDLSYIELSEYLPKYFGMIILTKDMTLETFSDNMVKVLMPFKTSELVSTIEMMTSEFKRTIRRKKSIPVKRSAKEQQIIDEAKRLLINRNGMSEPEAFRYIQKNSMDTGRSMIESAQMILMLSE